jgi:osmotically inducible protein OsmC
MPTRTSSARWQGSLKDGAGEMALGSGAFRGSYSYPSRFEEGTGTNPEELIAAHAGCFSMAFSNGLSQAGYTVNSVDTEATVHLGRDDSGPAITRIDLVTRGDIPGIDEAQFTKIAEEAKAGCPVSKALGAVKEITLQATLTS